MLPTSKPQQQHHLQQQQQQREWTSVSPIFNAFLTLYALLQYFLVKVFSQAATRNMEILRNEEGMES